jgi:hypothetical protein
LPHFTSSDAVTRIGQHTTTTASILSLPPFVFRVIRTNIPLLIDIGQLSCIECPHRNPMEASMNTPFPQIALATVTNPQMVDCHPALLQSAWCTLKHARGQTVHLDRLSLAMHLITRPSLAPPTHGIGPASRRAALAEQLTQARTRCVPRIHARMAELRREATIDPTNGGTAA